MDDRIKGYAAGILELARAEGSLERVENELFAISQSLGRSGELRSTLTDQAIPLERKQAVIDDLIGARASRLTLGLVQFLVSQGRGGDLPAIAKALVEKAAEIRDRQIAEVRSAIELDQAIIDRLTEALGKATGKRVEVKTIVDPSVLGGIVARVGDTVIDGSISGRIASLRQAVQGS